MRQIYREKYFVCGDYKEVYIYPCYSQTTKKGCRHSKAKPTTEAQKKLNKRITQNKLIRLLNANFTADDLSFDLTYAEENHPDSDKQALSDVKNFLRRLARLRKNKGLPELKYIYVPAKGTKSGRYHHHLVLNGGVSIQELAKLWGLGYTDAAALQFNETGLIQKGCYLLKQNAITCHGFCASRNLIQPQPTVRDGRFSQRKMYELSQALDDRQEYAKLYEGFTLAEASSFYNEGNSSFYICVRLYKNDATFNGAIRKRRRE
ncbi:MAG: hypothetical protein K2N23_00255 [Clostridia bacterium]|nr:hypothetical protein [Clostridia bacterium]